MAKGAYLRKQCPRLRTGWKRKGLGDGDGDGSALTRLRRLGVRRRRCRHKLRHGGAAALGQDSGGEEEERKVLQYWALLFNALCVKYRAYAHHLAVVGLGPFTVSCVRSFRSIVPSKCGNGETNRWLLLNHNHPRATKFLPSPSPLTFMGQFFYHPHPHRVNK